MKFSVSSKALHNSAASVSKVINSKNAYAIFNNFLLTIKDDTLTITGSDIENSLSAFLHVEDNEGEGSFCVDASRFVSLLKEIPDQGVTVNVDANNKVTIEYSNGSCEFASIPGEEFPSYKNDDKDEPKTFVCPASVIERGIANTAFATSDDDYRPMMMGILFDIHNNGITFVATDTRKLVRFIDNTCAPGVEISCIVPEKPASILRNVFGVDGGDVEITLTSKSATIRNDRFLFRCRFLQGNFPQYNKVIPTNNSLLMTIDRLALLNAVRRVSLFITQEFGLEKFRITPDKVEIRADDMNMMTAARESVPCSFTGENLVMGFSAPYLMDILNTIKSTDILISLSDPSRPGLFRPSEDAEGTEMVVLLMPMTVGEF